MEPYVEKPLADEEWLQNYRKEKEDKEGLARELKSTLMSVPVSESHPPSTIFSFCCPYNTESHTLWSESSTVKKSYRSSFYQVKICSHFSFFFDALHFASRRFLRILLGSAVLLNWVVTHLLVIFKGIISHYTVYIAIPFSQIGRASCRERV